MMGIAAIDAGALNHHTLDALVPRRSGDTNMAREDCQLLKEHSYSSRRWINVVIVAYTEEI